MTQAQWKAAMMLVGVFLLGTVAGVSGTLGYVAHERADEGRFDVGHRGELILKAFSRRLNLTAEQRRKVAAIVEEHGPAREQAMRDVMDRCGDALKEEKSKMDAQIRTLLDPKQQKEFDELAAQQGERLFAPLGPGFGRREGRGHGPGR